MAEQEEMHYWELPSSTACNFWKARWLQEEYEQEAALHKWFIWCNTHTEEESKSYENPCYECKTCKELVLKEKKSKSKADKKLNY